MQEFTMTDENKRAHGRRIQEARNKKHLTVAQFAEKVGVSEPYVRQFEGGFRIPKYETMLRISTVLDCRMEFFTQDFLFTSEPLLMNDITLEMQGLPLQRINEIRVVVKAMTSYMRADKSE